MIYSVNRSRVRQRFYEKQNFQYGVVSWGSDNIYPQLQRSYINASPISKRCVNTFGDFVAGEGFENEEQNGFIVNEFGLTLKGLLDQICESQYNYFKTVTWHISYNLLGEISAIKTIPVTYCRLGDPSDEKTKGKVAVWNNWAGEDYKFSWKGELFHEFNPDPSVVAAQIEEVGGYENYKGQVLFENFSNARYVESFLDESTEDMAADADIAVYRNSNLRNGFSGSGFMKYNGKVESEGERAQIIEMIGSQQGAENAGNVIVIFPTEGEIESEVPLSFTPTSLPNVDNLYTNQEKSIRENIAGAANIPKALLSQFFGDSSIFNQDQLINSWNYYNIQTRRDRMKIEYLFNKNIRPYFREDFGDVKIKEQQIVNQDGNAVNTTE